MPLKFVTCDLLISKDNRVWVTELCPPLSCARLMLPVGMEAMNFRTIMCKHLAALSPQSFKMVQAPQEPAPHSNLLSHYLRDADKLIFSKFRSGKIAKEQVRLYLSKIIRQPDDSRAALWVMYFRDITIGDMASKFSLLLKKLFTRLKVNIPVVEAYSLGFACEQDKVLFWQLLKLENSELMIPKEIFRFSTFDARQKQKLANFLEVLPGEKVIIKPTNSSLTYGTLVVPKDTVVPIIQRITDLLRQPLPQNPGAASLTVWQLTRGSSKLPLKPLIQFVKETVFPYYASESDLLVKKTIDMTVEKFVCFWFKIDEFAVQGTEYDFFLVEAFKPPRQDVDPINKNHVAVASRAFFVIPDTDKPEFPPPPLIHSKRCYQFKKSSKSSADIIGISFCYNLYATLERVTVDTPMGPELAPEWAGIITDYSFRAIEYQVEVYKAFQPAREQSWMRKLATWPLSDFMAAVRAVNVQNRELLEYLDSSTVQNLNLEEMEFCWACFKLSTTLKKCTACKEARYCDEKCQRADWGSFHKEECKLLKV